MGKRKKHAGGRPPKYTKPETMQDKIDKYFASCFIASRDRNGKILRDEWRKCGKNTSETIYCFWTC